MEFTIMSIPSNKTVSKVVFFVKNTNIVHSVILDVVVGLWSETQAVFTEDMETFSTNVLIEAGEGHAEPIIQERIQSVVSSYNELIQENPQPMIGVELLNENGETVKVQSYNTNYYDIIEYDGNNDPSGDACVGYTYDSERNAFIPPCPTEGYVLNEITLQWEPDPEVDYDLHGDGKTYRYNVETSSWYPTW
jgi:hypothetical protein